MKKIFTKLFASAMIVSMAFSLFVATAKAAINIQLSGVANGGIYNSAAPVFGASGANVSATLNGGSFASGTLVNQAGFYRLVITARNGTEVNFRDAVFTIDTTAPVITITGVYNSEITDQNVRPYFSTNEGNVSATLNGGSFASGTLITSEGTYSLVVTARDAAGNVTFKDIVFTIRRGTTPPVNPPVTPPVENPVNPVVGIIKTAKSTVKIAKAATITPVAESTCAVPCVDPFDAILKDVNITKIENADGLGGNLNSCRNVRITGHAQDGLLVILYIEKDGSDVPMIGFVKAGAGDEYQFVTDKPLAAGDYTVFAKLAQEGGKTGPMIEVGSFHVERCNRLVVWMWLLIILIVLIAAGLIGWFMSRRRHAQKEVGENEEDIFGDIDEMAETTDADATDSHKDRL
jgi:hypothetical protein